jgi:hypothetical protein
VRSRRRRSAGRTTLNAESRRTGQTAARIASNALKSRQKSWLLEVSNWTVSSAAAHDGARLEAVLDRNNLASSVWADTAYRSAKNEAMLT